MYLKKTAGPRAVTLPDGSVFTMADLPDVNTTRWVASRKARVVRGVECGLITRDEAITRYDLSEEEYAEWVKALRDHGPAGLKTTQIRRQTATLG